MSSTTKTFDVFCELYGTNLFVVSGYTHDEMSELLKRRFKINLTDFYETKTLPIAGAVMSFDKWPFHVMWLGKKYHSEGSGTKIEKVGRLAHEVYHHVQRLCVAKGIPTYPEIDNLIMDEPAAYLMEFYMKAILKKLWK